MWTKGLMVVSAALMLGAAAHAAEKPGKPLNIKPSAVQSPDDWRGRAMRARAEAEPDGAPARGNARARDERGERRDGEEAGGGSLRQDRGEGGDRGE